MTDKDAPSVPAPTARYRCLVEQEQGILEATELLCKVMESEGVSRAELARRMGKSRGFVTQVLSGKRNMTIRTLSHALYVLGHRVTMDSSPLAAVFPAIGSSAPDATEEGTT